MTSDKRQFWWTMTVQSIEILHHLADNFHDDMFAMSGDALTRNTQIANQLTRNTHQ